MKLVGEEIIAPLTHIVNLSIEKSTFPAIWKQAKVIPLLKKEDPLNPKNYRPVALLPIFRIYNQLIQYLNKEGLIHPNHHCHCLIQIHEIWVEEVDNGNMDGIMMVD